MGEEYDEGAPPSGASSKKKKSKPKQSNSSGGGGNGGGGIECGDCSPNIACGGGLVGIAQIATCIAAIGQFILGIIQFILLAEALETCDSELSECCGKSLYWKSGGDETDSFNPQWRLVFTFAPSYFFTNWSPMLFGMIAMMQMFYSTSW